MKFENDQIFRFSLNLNEKHMNIIWNVYGNVWARIIVTTVKKSLIDFRKFRRQQKKKNKINIS